MIRADTLAARYAVLSAIIAYADDGGLSRGSYLMEGRDGIDTAHADRVLETAVAWESGRLRTKNRFVPVRPIPETDNWFENVYNAYDSGERFSDAAEAEEQKEDSAG